jgi:hypothetical protein
MKLLTLIVMMALLSANFVQAELGPVTKSIVVKYSTPDRIPTNIAVATECSEVGITENYLRGILHRKLVLNRVKPDNFGWDKQKLFIDSWIGCLVENLRITATIDLILRIQIGDAIADHIKLGYSRGTLVYAPKSKIEFIYDAYEEAAEEITADFIGAHLEAEDIRDAMPSNQRSVRKY